MYLRAARTSATLSENSRRVLDRFGRLRCRAFRYAALSEMQAHRRPINEGFVR